jgi:hypothetical protein
MLPHILRRSHPAPVLQRSRDVGRQENSLPADSLSCVALTPYMHKAEQVLETAEIEYAGVFNVGRTSATIGPFERLRNLTYSLVRDSPCSVLSI